MGGGEDGVGKRVYLDFLAIRIDDLNVGKTGFSGRSKQVREKNSGADAQSWGIDANELVER